MRPIEALLSLLNLLIFFVLAIPLPRTVFWIRYLAPIALIVAVLQILTEGSRWQMIPAYILTILFFLLWLLQNSMPDNTLSSPPLWKFFVIGLSTLGLVISFILPIILPVVHFPHPSGPYEIGTLTYHWVDVNRQEVFSADSNDHRELMVQIWYPAKKVSPSAHAPYIQDSDAVVTVFAQLLNLPGFSLKHIKYFTTNTISSAPIADDESNYPVLIFLEGLTGYRQMNTFQVEELVSHGYIVVGIDQPGAAALVAFPDGHQIAIQSVTNVMQPLVHQSLSPAEITPQLNGQTMPDGIIPYFRQDVSFSLDQLESTNTADPQGILTGKLNLQQIGVFGMSLGGMVGAEACLKDPRIKACLIEDVAITANVVQKSLQQPTMFITRPADTMRLERQTAGGWAEADIVQTQTTMRAVYNSLAGDGYFVQVPGMFHIDFTDLNLLSPIFPNIGFSGPIGGQRAHNIINAYSLAFFDGHLKGHPQALLKGPAKQYPEVLFETRQPQSTE